MRARAVIYGRVSREEGKSDIGIIVYGSGEGVAERMLVHVFQ